MTEDRVVKEASPGDTGLESTKSSPAIWGLSASDLHDAWWRSHGVQVVHRDEDFDPIPEAEVFLLLPPGVMVLFPIEDVAGTLVWSRSSIIPVVIYEKDEDSYREEIRRGADGGVLGINRTYQFRDANAIHAAFTIQVDEARDWAASAGIEEVGKRKGLTRPGRSKIEIFGHVFYESRFGEFDRLLRSLIAIWPNPSHAIEGIKQPSPGIFLLEDEMILKDMTLIPPVWIGAGRSEANDLVAVGPEFVTDAQPGDRPKATLKRFAEITPQEDRRTKRLLPRRTYYGVGKRLFDIVFAFAALVVSMPVLAVVALAMILDDGFPIFFGHVRQARGGRSFRCWKLRTMRRNAEELVAKLAELNIADGPQVLIENDPRVTRIGRYLRKFQIDELPQFWNVLCGQMSVVGPRPSPEKENQYCPAWREMRLSVRPGITGLWQVSRTRTPGEDFQEWIKYDVEYVRTATFSGDLKIIAKTIGNLLKRD